MATVLICDERPECRDELIRVLSALPGIRGIDCVSHEHLPMRYAQLPADLVLVGVRCGTGDGATAMRRLLAAHPAANLLAFGSVDTDSVASAMSAGARGFLRWQPSQHVLVATIACTLALSCPVVPPPRRASHPDVDLSQREIEILTRMARGKSNDQIGRELYLSPETVKTHTHRLFRKLGAHDRAHAVARALRYGMIP